MQVPKMGNPITTRLCHVIYCCGDKSNPCLVVMGLNRFLHIRIYIAIITYYETSLCFQVENMLSTYEPHACVVVYSVVDRGTFQNAEDILGYLWRFGFAKKMTLLLVANKVDMERSRLVTCEGNLYCQP